MLRRSDGSVLSENTPSGDFERDARFSGIYRVLLTKVNYVDDNRNIYKNTASPEVTYDGVIIGGKDEGQVISSIRDATAASGEDDNFSERIYKVCTKPLTGNNAIPLNKQDGSIVYISFINKDPSFPLIVGRAKNALDRTSTGATKTDGPLKRWQYNGIFFQVDKNGIMTLKRKGGTLDGVKNVFNPNSSGNEVFLEFSKNKVSFSVGNNSVNQIVDGDAEKMTLTFKSGLVVTIDGAGDSVKIVTKGGAKAEVDGKTGTISLKDNATGALKITGSKVALGASSAELLQQISDQLQKLQTFFTSIDATHTHIGNLGYETALPTQTTDFVQIGTDLGVIKGKIDGIKGTL